LTLKSILDRRNFLRLASAGAAILTQAVRPKAMAGQAKVAPAGKVSGVKNRKNFVAIQMMPYAWLDEGVDKVLDNLQQRGNVNTVWAYTFQYTGERLRKGGMPPLPDHGVSGDPNVKFVGGAYYDYDPKYFQNTFLKDFRSPDYGKFNVIAEVAPKVKARGMDFFAWDYNNAFPLMMESLPGAVEVAEIDVYGRRTTSPCFNHPDYRAFLTGKVESQLSGYAELIDGFAWGCERMGPLQNMIGGGWSTKGISCFCRFCRAKARERDISVERAQTGYRKLDELFTAGAKDQRPADGYFVSFWRLLLQYPEILSWETLWTDSYHEIRAELYGTGKAIAPEKPFGYHIMQNMTFSPFYRAEEDYSKTRHYADFLKLATYNNAAGPRLASYLDRLSETVFHDATPAEFLPFFYKIMDMNQGPYDQLHLSGLTADYVARETKRALEGVNGETKIYPGIDIDVPTAMTDKRTNPDDVRAAVRAALGAGADGVVLSREYVEMQNANLTAAGDTLREIFAKQGS
jgi:hypothetical protein